MTMMSLTTMPLASNTLVYSFSHSDFVGQAICVILIVLSAIVWIGMLNKSTTLRKFKVENDKFVNMLKNARNPLAIKEEMLHEACPIVDIYLSATSLLTKFHIDPDARMRRALSDDELEIMRNTMNQTVEEQITKLNSGKVEGLLFLSIAVSGSPFLGLFGTVWGILYAFTEMAVAGKSDLQTLAPGVAGALLTTVFALVVAIPSMIGYNVINNQVRDMTVAMDGFVDLFITKLKVEQMDAINAANEAAAKPQQ